MLKELRPLIPKEDDLLEWFDLAAKPVLSRLAYNDVAVQDAQDYVVSVLVYDEDHGAATHRSRATARVCSDLLSILTARTGAATNCGESVAASNGKIAGQVEAVLISFGKKMPKHFFYAVDGLIVLESTRLKGLLLLSSFLKHQTPHLWKATQTPIVDHLLKCLMNDKSTTILQVALTSLIMLLPQIPGALKPLLPRLFLVYSRFLCWERYDPFSTEAQRSLVTDERVSDDDYDDVGIDASWEVAHPPPGAIEATAPELTTYFTLLYGLYPLSFMSYIRKPRKYLKSVDFPGADDFALDRAVIRSRSDVFRRAHLVHPNFYTITIEEELQDAKWTKMDAADVLAECTALAADNIRPARSRSVPASPFPPPTKRLPDIPRTPIFATSNDGTASPAYSHMSLRSGTSWRDTASTAVGGTSVHESGSPIRGPQGERSDDVLSPRTASGPPSVVSPTVPHFSLPSGAYVSDHIAKDAAESRTDEEYLRQKVTNLQNALDFERWHKAQYSTHIGQLTRKNVKDAIAEADTLNLLNANRALKQQLEQIRGAREATIKDAALTRKQANNLEANVTERLNKMKKEQENWAAEAEELKRLRSEMQHYRDLLSAAEARDLNKAHQLQSMKQDLDEVQKLRAQLQETRRTVRDYELREFEFDSTKRELEIAESEKRTLGMKIQQHQHERDRTKRMYSERLSELEAQIEDSGDNLSQQASPSTHERRKLVELQTAHLSLVERYTDLEASHSSLKQRLMEHEGGESAELRDIAMGDSFTAVGDSRQLPEGYVYGDHPVLSASDPTSERRNPDSPNFAVSPPGATPGHMAGVGLTFKRPATVQSQQTKHSSQRLSQQRYTRPSTPRAEERSVFSDSTKSTDSKKTNKIAADSEMRVYGRGGAQNVKMKAKEKDDAEGKKGSGSLKALKGLAGLRD